MSSGRMSSGRNVCYPNVDDLSTDMFAALCRQATGASSPCPWQGLVTQWRNHRTSADKCFSAGDSPSRLSSARSEPFISGRGRIYLSSSWGIDPAADVTSYKGISHCCSEHGRKLYMVNSDLIEMYCGVKTTFRENHESKGSCKDGILDQTPWAQLNHTLGQGTWDGMQSTRGNSGTHRLPQSQSQSGAWDHPKAQY